MEVEIVSLKSSPFLESHWNARIEDAGILHKALEFHANFECIRDYPSAHLTELQHHKRKII